SARRFFPVSHSETSCLTDLIWVGPCLAADGVVKKLVAGDTLKHHRIRGTSDRRNGFSLLEVLMVVGISTVVAAIAVPMMKNTIGDFKWSGDLRGLPKPVPRATPRPAS